MKVFTLLILFAVVALVNCHHMFIGTNTQPMVYNHIVDFPAKPLKKTIEDLCYTMPKKPKIFGKCIQGILAYDLCHSGATVSILEGGIGYTFVRLRMKSDRAKKLNYEISIFA